MKICFIALEVIPVERNTFVGGTANNIIRLSKGLTNRGHEIHIVTSDVNHVLNGDLCLPYARIHPVSINAPYTTLPYGMELITKLLYKALKLHSKENFDIFDIHSGYSTLCFIALLISFLTHTPAIFTLYSAMEQKDIYPGELFRRLPMLIEARGNIMLSKVKRVVVLSQNVKRLLKKIGVPAEKIVRIPPTIDTTIFNPNISKQKARQKFGLGSDEITILYLGNWNPWKGVNVFIESIGQLIKEFPSIRPIIAWGEPISWHIEYRDSVFRRIKELKIEQNLIQLGVINNVAELIAACDIVVVPFLTTYGVADIPLTIIEAMACGRPVVATKVGGVPEVIENGINGLLVKPGKPDEIFEAIRFLLTDQNKMIEIGLRAAQTALNYSIDNVVCRLEKVYEEVKENV
jgi:glycosyltransferase involved in cell wall biosynthesis